MRYAVAIVVVFSVFTGCFGQSAFALSQKAETISDFFEIALESKQKPDMTAALEDLGMVALGPVLDAIREYRADEVIKKWSGQIVVSLKEGLFFSGEKNFAKRDLAYGAINDSLEVLAAASGIDLQFAEDNEIDKANVLIEIVLFERANIYKKNVSRYDPNRITGYWKHSEDGVEYINDATPFTAGLENQVDGFLVTNQRHEITFAYCSIWGGHEVPMIRRLSTECILRVLGLPGVSVSRRDHYLGHWNRNRNAQRSDPDNCTKYSLDFQTSEIRCREAVKPNEGSNEGGKGEAMFEVEDQISCYDVAMVSFLYDENLRPGMTEREASPILHDRFNDTIGEISEFALRDMCHD